MKKRKQKPTWEGIELYVHIRNVYGKVWRTLGWHHQEAVVARMIVMRILRIPQRRTKAQSHKALNDLYLMTLGALAQQRKEYDENEKRLK